MKDGGSIVVVRICGGDFRESLAGIDGKLDRTLAAVGDLYTRGAVRIAVRV